MTALRLGTRGSALALTQSQLVADALSASTGRQVDLVTITTLGDTHPGPLDTLPQQGAFVTALRSALLRGDVDFVVHSMKDLPSEPVEGIRLAAVPVRADPRDALVSTDGAGVADLAPGATVGTGSPRRAARLLATRPDLHVVAMRGNVDTRVAHVRSGDVDAAVLAVAGLARLGRLDEIAEIIGIDVMLPAPAQGALAVECRVDDELGSTLAVLDDGNSRLIVTAERAVLSALDASCASAIGALCTRDDGLLTLSADVSGTTPDTHAQATATCRIDHGDELGSASGLGRQVAQLLLEAGAGQYVRPRLTDG